MPKQPKKGAKVACIITGKVKYIAECFLKKKIAKYGSVEEYRQFYVSNSAKRWLKQGKTVAEVRDILGSGQDLPDVDLEILTRLKLVKKRKRDKDVGITDQQREESRLETQLRTEEYQKQVMSYGREGAWIREISNNENGGTCHRPDIFFANDKACDGCPLHEHCQCYNKRLSHEPRINKSNRRFAAHYDLDEQED